MNTLTIEILKQLLVAPGNGVHTVHTASQIKEKLQPLLYNNSKNFNNSWEASLNEISDQKIFLLGIASDCGAGILRGSNWGPLFLRQEIYSNQVDNFFDLGDIKIIPHLLHDKYLNQKTIKQCQDSIFTNSNKLPVSPLSITEKVLDLIFESKKQAKFISLGGDHSVSYPLVHSYLKNYQTNQQEDIAIIHFDAHTDLMLNRMGIDYCFASWAAHIALELNNPNNLIQFGIRSSGQEKQYWENKFNIKQYWSNELNIKQEIDLIVQNEIKNLKNRNIKKIYISFDIDALDASIASATGTPEGNGMSLNNSIYIIKKFCDSFELIGCDLVEVAPFTCSKITYKKNEPKKTLQSSLEILKLFIKYLN